MSASAITDAKSERLSHNQVDADTLSSTPSNVTSSSPETLFEDVTPTLLPSEPSMASALTCGSSSKNPGVQTSPTLSSQSQSAVAYNTAVKDLFLRKGVKKGDKPLLEYLVGSQPLQKVLLAPGDILWLNAVPFGLDKTLLSFLSSADPSETPQISNHPCIVLDILPENGEKVEICLVRTFGGRNPRNLRTIKGRDQAYICTIDHPEVQQGHSSIVFKHRNPRATLPKPSYVDTRSLHVYQVSTILLRKFGRDLPVKHYSLDDISTQNLMAIVRRSKRVMEEGEWRIRQQECQVYERALDMETQHLLYVEDTKMHHPTSIFCEDWCKNNSREVGETEYRDCGNCMNHLHVERFRGLDCHNRECACPKSSRP